MPSSILTPEGYQKLLDELKYLREIKSRELSERIQEAKEHGDLRENAEYHEAREEQGFVNGRIIEIENILKTSEVVNRPEDNLACQIGSQIELEAEGEIYKYTVVGSHEADPLKGLISCESPLGVALLGHKIGETVVVELPRGLVNYKIVALK